MKKKSSLYLKPHVSKQVTFECRVTLGEEAEDRVARMMSADSDGTDVDPEDADAVEDMEGKLLARRAKVYKLRADPPPAEPEKGERQSKRLDLLCTTVYHVYPSSNVCESLVAGLSVIWTQGSHNSCAGSR